MDSSIIVALVTGGLSLIGVIISNLASNHAIETKIEVSQAVTETKITELTREVREHNGFAQKIPVLEEKINSIDARVKEIEKK